MQPVAPEGPTSHPTEIFLRWGFVLQLLVEQNQVCKQQQILSQIQREFRMPGSLCRVWVEYCECDKGSSVGSNVVCYIKQ